MAGEDQSDNDAKLTPRMAIDVFSNRGTPDEERLVRAALNDPHSVIHDWLEGVENWATRAFRRQSNSSRVGDEMLRDSSAKADYEDVVGWIRELCANAKISDQDMRWLLGVDEKPPSQDKNFKITDYRQESARILETLQSMHPELAVEIERVRSALHRGITPKRSR